MLKCSFLPMLLLLGHKILVTALFIVDVFDENAKKFKLLSL